MTELAKQYDPASIEPSTTARWLAEKCFAATPDERDNRYVIMMPLPNVTGALHMGHAMDNVLQDMLTRWHRMQGDNSLWMAGTDHAGIATQSVVEKRLLELEGKSRHDVGRDALVARIWEWKDQYQQRIVQQQQAMGCSCDWDRQRFTMDEVCARAVRHTFFRMFREGLIYQGDRLVNWDCQLQTAVADDELYKETVHGHFWHLRYPVVDPQPGEPTHITVATTRPETMLGDTAVACHAEPRKVLDALIADCESKLGSASAKDRPDVETELERLRERRSGELSRLEQIAKMARDGRKVRLPLQNREIPIIVDEWAKPELGSGCVKITPAHDPNDYEVWQRHRDHIDIINILEPNGTLNASAGDSFAGLDRFDARKQVVAALEDQGLLDRVEDREIEIDHSDRSKSIIEPYLSKQWFVRMADVDGGIVMGQGTDKEFRAEGLAQAAIDAASGEWKSSTGRGVRFWPDHGRYHKIFHSWLVEKRDWCISRQLWWGHRIPVWSGAFPTGDRTALAAVAEQMRGRDDVAAWVVLATDLRVSLDEALNGATTEGARVLVCGQDQDVDQAFEAALTQAGLERDPDVLDTWFSSALWPHSTLGWPDPETAPVLPGQTPTASADGRPDTLSYYYPGSCLVTGRDIITLWVARMVVAGLYNLGDVPFTDVFLHASILDGKGVRMSKSKGNGIDPLDIIERYGADAMRYVLCEMQTGTQDIRLPVQAISPFDGELIDMAKAKASTKQGVFLDPKTGQEFDVVGLYESEGLPQAKATSDRFEVGRNFCNKLWNAARFALLNLEGTTFTARRPDELEFEDTWILSRLTETIQLTQSALEVYNPSAAVGALREFFWSELCDWYLELLKPRMRDENRALLAQQILAHCIDQVLRLFQPFVPFITEALWSKLGEMAPERGINAKLFIAPTLATAEWPVANDSWRDETVEAQFGFVQEIVSSIREVRARYQVASSTRMPISIRGAGASAAALEPAIALITATSGAESIAISTDAQKPDDAAVAVVRDVEVYVHGVIDREQELAKLKTQREKLAGQVKGLVGKLSNQGFVAKAPAAVVDGERAKLEDLESQIAKLDANIQSLS